MAKSTIIPVTCAFCGAKIKLQPGPYVYEEGKHFCSRNCAYEYRVGMESIRKQSQMGGM
tara:strand:+ start:321 stop:497 length:177 start_codon:yes stop_codon:yes gene_type:complete